jgi:L-2,4-diaminobutyrate transaminase
MEEARSRRPSTRRRSNFGWYYNNALGRPAKKKIISRWRGYHGATVLAGSLTGLEIFHRAFDLPQGPVLHTATPHFYWHAPAGMTELEFSQRCADELEALVLKEGPETVAAFIGGPMLATGGLIPPPARVLGGDLAGAATLRRAPDRR